MSKISRNSPRSKPTVPRIGEEVIAEIHRLLRDPRNLSTAWIADQAGVSWGIVQRERRRLRLTKDRVRTIRHRSGSLVLSDISSIGHHKVEEAKANRRVKTVRCPHCKKRHEVEL